MADIAPFHGTHYSPQAGDPALVVSPPYDVIPPDEQEALYARDPLNVVRIILNRAEAGDEPCAAYARAAATLQDWRARGILVEDDRASLYLYRQTFASPLTGASVHRTGLFCALRLEPYEAGVVLPHEHTKPGAKADRLALMRATDANVEPIMGLYEDPGLATIARLASHVAGTEPLLRADVDGQVHEVWAVSDEAVVGAVARDLADRRVWIADGHHRYETALTFRNGLCAERLAALPGADRILIALIPFEDPGIVVLPTHRLVLGMPGAATERLMDDLAATFDVAPLPTEGAALEAQSSLRSRDGALIAYAAGQTVLLTLRDPSAMLGAAPQASDIWRSLDVSILQALVLDPLVVAYGAELAYTRDAAEAMARVRSGECSAAFLVGAPSAQDVRE
ncbi:MAG: DUF1015 domain-containing protein, partial [Armatimonadetes bacterium]|nr:DUF1015 domain-containing protein [Armatimonadota bacterium]